MRALAATHRAFPSLPSPGGKPFFLLRPRRLRQIPFCVSNSSAIAPHVGRPASLASGQTSRSSRGDTPVSARLSTVFWPANRASASVSSFSSAGKRRETSAMALARALASAASRISLAPMPDKLRNHWSRACSISANRFSATNRLLSRCVSSTATSAAISVFAFTSPSTARAASRYKVPASSTFSGCAPKRAASGICRVIDAFSASMVRIRRRDVLRVSCQPRSMSRASAAQASVRVCASSVLAVSVASAKAESTRSRISAAALRVKVMATISSGSSTRASNARKR